MQFGDYVLENYIAADSKFPPILWAKPPDLLFPYKNNGAESYHRHLNAEFYVKHPNMYAFVDVLKKVQQTALPRIACHSRHGSLNTSERRPEFVVSICYDYRTHSLLQERSFWRKCVIVTDREPNCDNAPSIGFVLLGLFSCVFVQFFHAFLYTFVVRFYTMLKCVFIINAFS